MAEHTLGYDFRFAFEVYAATHWNDDRRDGFLLRPEIDMPASVDPLVWPSLFTYPGDFIARHPDGLARIQVTPEHILQRALGLWPEFESMANVLAAAEEEHDLIESGISIAITLVDLVSHERDTAWSALIDLGAEAEPPPDGWTLMGYDVADGGFISGLSNCAYDRIERDAFKHIWASRLNGFGLLRSTSEAAEFRELSNRRVPEHQPFYVYGLYRRAE